MICLHDASHDALADQEAPLNTIRALDIAIPQLKSKKVNFISLKRSGL